MRFCLIILLLLSFGCKQTPEKPERLIPEKKYINLLVELQLVRSFSETTSKDSLSTDSLMQEVFNKYDISRQVFEQSHKYYEKFPKQQKERINRAIELLKLDQVRNDTTQTAPSDSLG
ncbi:MAG TPA: DUF4296 domain-containing protein [Balneolaceae bacterium]|nr:DUF4296 domain-containing protein [Balneolaceae bacterium]